MMTFTEVLPAARQLAAAEKLKLIRILAEDLEAIDDMLPMTPGKIYDFPTPYDCFGVGAILMEAFKKSDSKP